ncbi:hypothetical protein Poli38472_007481 [Pythium oligandrum]|uniref:Kinesin-like protein n=1 Tax=Pythium oligandrum TaxID=41045 RepID=A0A8K1CQK8_PYTOL|nr:hypothetical protein Poli38472_007481 [Pythium oligandrum]|eukprot:TMW67809.1 hypothetical protein Poli38472_007481 [Pythium oligandrum]
MSESKRVKTLPGAVSVNTSGATVISSSLPNAASRAERVKVFCRVRPLLQRERDGWSYDDFCEHEQGTNQDDTSVHDDEPVTGRSSSTFLTEKGKIPLDASVLTIAWDGKAITHHGSSETKDFAFDASLSEHTTQEDVYQRVAYDVVQDVLDGYNGTILAYGQTSTGKTHTMLGHDDGLEGDGRGLIPRAFEDIFARAESARARCKTTIALSYVQIYCERVLDLLRPETPSSSILIREDAERGVYLDGAAWCGVSSVEDCVRLIMRGNANRAVASTEMNAHSSRSHAILIARVERKECLGAQEATATSTHRVKLSHLYFVDLAGSERVKKSKVYGRHVHELKAINLSLSALGNCISALSRQQPQRHVPYRDSKLTRLLQSSLGGNAKTSLIITVSPSPTEAHETLSTMQFGQRAMKVAVQAHQNVLSVLDYKALYEETQQRLDEQQQVQQHTENELSKLQTSKQHLEDQLVKAQLRIQHLEFECQAVKVAPTTSTTAASASDEQVQALIKQHEADLAHIQAKCDLQVATYKRLAEEAQQEWHELEDSLAQEKQQVLSCLQELKEFKMRFFQLEEETTERIAELVQDGRDHEREYTETRDTLQQRVKAQEQELEAMKKKLAGTEERIQQLQDQMELDFVPKQAIKQMESLYESAISKLQTRVGSLEQRSSSRKLQTNQERDDPPVDPRKGSNANNGGLPAIAPAPPVHKAIPKIGRIVPGARANSLR